MSIFDTVVLVWLASVVLVTLVGFFRGRTAEALDMGIFLGPVGLVLVVFMISSGRKPLSEVTSIVRIEDATPRLSPTTVSGSSLQRAA